MRYAIAGTVLVLLVAGCEGSGGSILDRAGSTMSFEGNTAALRVRLADTAEERRLGLMGVMDLPADEGMVFVFDEPVRTTFWMKDTTIPLSIAFVDMRDRIVEILDMEPCDADPCPRYGAKASFVLAIEANRGWFGAHGVEVGDLAELREGAYG